MRTDLTNELTSRLKKLNYSDRTYSSMDFPIIRSEHMPKVEAVIRETVFDFYDSKVGELEAKTRVYEEIISKSNFSLMIEESSEDAQESEEVLMLKKIIDRLNHVEKAVIEVKSGRESIKD